MPRGIRHPNRRPKRILIVLPPLTAVVIESDLRRIAYKFSQRFDGAAHAVVPIARQHPMSKCMPGCVARVGPPDRIMIPTQLLANRPKPTARRYFLPGIALRIAEDRNFPIPLALTG